jgi:hypothetical protein
MARYYEDYDVPSVRAMSDAAADAAERQRIRQMQEVAKSTQPVVGLGASLAALQRSIDESKAVSVQQTASLAESQFDVGLAAEAQIQARADAEKIAAETGAKIDPNTGKITPPSTSTFPKAGTILRYRASRAGFRIPIIADGKGGEYEGTEEKDPDYKPGGGGNQFVEYEYNKDFTKRRAKYFNSATGQFTYGEWEDVPKTKEDYDKEQAAASAAAAALQEKRDAFSLIEATMRSYGFTESELNEIIKFIQNGLIDPNMGPNQLTLALRQLPAYKARFFGNEERRARGLNTLSEAEYLQQEQDYSATFRQRGLQRFATRGQFATLIGNDISNTEVGKRIDIAVERVQYGDPQVLKQLKTYYNITETDIAAYYLNPKEVLPELEAKTTTAEIGSAAVQYGLSAERERAEGLRAFGVDLTKARAGYGLISERLPRTQQLSDIYRQSGITYTQTTAEEEEFKGTASAKRARERLKELEIGSFIGTSGVGRTSLGKGTAGLI